MTDDSVSLYFEFYRVNLNGEKKPTEWFLGSNLQCCLHATVLPTVKYSAELNKYILLVRVICEKYRLRGEPNLSCPRNRYFSQITLTNRIYLFNSAEYLTAIKTVAGKQHCRLEPRNHSVFFSPFKLAL